MNIIQDKILVVATTESKTIISNSLKDISGIELLEADSENKAFELIYNHFFVLVIIDETLPHIDMYKIGAMLLSHKKTHNAPLLIITDTIQPENFLTDFKALQIDYIVKPFDEQLILAKIKIFFELFKQKNAVDQSIDELDKVYKKIVDQHELVMEEEFSRKEIVNISSIAADQMQQPLRSLHGNIYQLLRSRDVSPKFKANLASIKTSTEKISQISKKLFAFPGKTKKLLTQNASDLTADQAYRILYLEKSDEDFSIFNHFIKGVIKCNLSQAKTLEQGLELIAGNKFDLIFTNHLLLDGTGFDLLSKLNRMRSDIPVVFTLDKPKGHKGPEAISKGAFTYYIKEEISSTNILSIIYSTLEKAKITREVEDAQNRIVMISQKDYLTKLFNRRCFEQELTSETSKAKRYKIPLSILILDFDQFEAINETHGYDTGDAILTTSAALIQSMVRDKDVVCRYGEEEFGIVLPNTALNGARMLAERIRKKIGDHEFEKGSKVLKLTVSIGIASYVPKTDTGFSVLVKKALDALTSAMDQGGNTIKTFIN
ncbi:MAG: diguanylate cyclase [Desulfobacula sp.]|uniref:diguanylate cyclase n=1 Tax=Desulfobacula sp. TaxID=2593537 RepID=UPI0025BED340|nr:diguanylate cyclase [Desulfobacula sp.]MCD4720908.1 diguanylate cyclase [Desulfobacula sp.]